jgi:DNA (cytosine-5)-methyltransferase 1
MTHFAAFAGINGFGIAAEWSGFETIGFSEIDPYCCQLLAEKYPNIRNYGDIRNTDAFSDLRGRVTVFSAGVPCQPASLAGKRRGKDDDRWLWPATLNVVDLVKPAWCIFENPPGILSLDEFSGILLRLESIGYQIRAFSVPANAVGAKHERRRVFAVAHSNVFGWNGRTMQESGQHKDKRALHDSSGSISTYEAVANAKGKQTARQGSGGLQPKPTQCSGSIGGLRVTEPPLCRRTDGISNRSHRLKALGNSCVPAQAFPFFEAIAQVERNLTI